MYKETGYVIVNTNNLKFMTYGDETENIGEAQQLKNIEDAREKLEECDGYYENGFPYAIYRLTKEIELEKVEE